MQDIKTFLISDIKDITIDKILYMDNSIEKEIILNECALNYVKEYNANIEEYITWNGQPAEPLILEENRCIGERNWFADKPYFILFSNSKVKFQIEPKKHFLDIFDKHWYQRYYPDFFSIQMKLQQYNWHTFDLG